MKYIFLSFVLLIVSCCALCQNECYKRIIEESIKIDTLQSSSGTGFLISDLGLIVTNRHVVEGTKYLKVTFNINGKKVTKKAKLYGVDNEVDLAVLGIEDELDDLKDILKKPLPYGFSESPLKLGDNIYVLGYPSPDLLGTNIKLTDGLISSNTGFMDDNEMYQISAPIQPGNSGSPMFDKYGNIKGIVVASYINGQVVNYAIKSKFLKTMLNEYSWGKKNSTQLNVVQGPKPKPNGDFKSMISTISQRICLIENITRKNYYEELKFQENSFFSKSSSVFTRYNGECDDMSLEQIFKSEVYRNGLDKTDEEYLKNWVEKYFKNDFGRALFYTLVNNYNYTWNDFDYHYKLEYLDKIGAFRNIIEEHDFKYKISSNKINENDFQAYVAGYFPYYFKAMITTYENDFKKIRLLIKYVDFLISLNENIEYVNYKNGVNSNKSSLLLYKSRAMLQLQKEYKPEEICAIIQLAKKLDPEKEIWVEYSCDKNNIAPNGHLNIYEKQANEKYYQGKYFEAIELFNKALEEDPNNANCYYLRGLSYTLNGRANDDKALADLTKALKMNGDNYIYYYIGFIHQRQNKLTEALLDYSASLKDYPDNTDAYFMRALCKSSFNDRYGAINDYDEIIKREKTAKPRVYDMATVYNNKAYCLIELNQLTKALPLVNRAIELDKNKGYIWDTRGELFYKLNEYQKCIRDMTMALTIDKSSGNSYYYRGLANVKLSNKLEGCSDLSKARDYGKIEAQEALKQNCK